MNLQDKSMEESKTMRLQVYLSHSGVSSRRHAESLIEEGRVRVNGEVVREKGVKVSLNDSISLDGVRISLEEKKRYVLLNKPAGYVCSSKDEKGRREALSLIKDAYTERLYNVGRLDMMSSGAIIFTNDGEFCSCVEHPSSQIQKEYEVTTVSPFSNDVLQHFARGVRVEGVFYKAFKVSRLASCKMRIVLIEGKNREIRRVLQHFGIKIARLVRVRIGNVKLGDLKEGESRELSKKEVEELLLG